MAYRAALALLLVTLGAGCAAKADDSAVANEAALVSAPTGSFVIDRKPFDGPYVARLSLEAGKKFEIEYVSPVDDSEEAVVYRGNYDTRAGEPGETILALEITDGMLEQNQHFIFTLQAATATTITLKSIVGDNTFTLKKSNAAPAPTDARVLTCKSVVGAFSATIRLDQAQRRRGTMSITPIASEGSPPKGDTPVVYTSDTGVEDYMRYEGRDAEGNRYDFALKRSELSRTSGSISEVGLGVGPAGEDFVGMTAMDCTIARQ